MQRLAIDSSSSNDDPDLGCCITEKIFSRCEALLKKEIFPASPGLCRPAGQTFQRPRDLGGNCPGDAEGSMVQV